MAPRQQTVMVRLKPQHKSRLQQEAERTHRPLANLISAILIDYIEALADSPKPNGHHAPKAARAAP